MKNIKQALASWSRKAAFASGCALLAVGFSAAAQPFASPVGSWDVVESGSRQAVARLVFNDDHTITLTEILLPKSVLKSTDLKSVDDSRGTGGDDGRGGSVTNGSALPAHTNLYGFVEFPSGAELNFTNYDDMNSPTGAIWVHSGIPAGQWNFDGSGKLVGFFAEIGPPMTITTNLIPFGQPVISDCQDVVTTGNDGLPILTRVCLTNQPYLTNVEYLRLTNSINFSGKVSLNAGDFTKSRITLMATTPGGKATFSGVIPIELPDLSGNWYTLKKQEGLPYNEFFSLEEFDSNTYDMMGTNAAYVIGGELLTVRQKKFGYVVDITAPHNPPPDDEFVKLRVVIGSTDFKHGKLTGSGVEDTDTSKLDKITYKAQLLPPDSE